MRRKALICWLVVAVGWMTPATTLAAPPSAATIAHWIKQLDDDRFDVREAATERLIEAGRCAIERTAAAAVGDSLEATDRALRILRELSSSKRADTAATATAALKGLAASKHAAASGRARAALLTAQLRIVAAIEQAGGTAQVVSDTVVTVDLDHAKNLATVLPLLRELPNLDYVSASNRLMDDAGLAQLKGLRKLRYLNLSST